MSADIECLGKLLVSSLALVAVDQIKDLPAINGGPAPVDNGIADLSYEHDKSGWGIVVLGVGPDEKNCVHDWLEDVDKLGELLSLVGKSLEELHQGLEVPVVLV